MSIDELITYCGIAGTINNHANIGRHWSSKDCAKKIYALEGVIGTADFWFKYYVDDTDEKIFLDGRVAHDHSVFGRTSSEVWSIESLMTEIEISS